MSSESSNVVKQLELVRGKHYQTSTNYQHWDLALDCWGPEYHLGNASKYVCRWRQKGGIDDLLKAATYLAKCRTHMHKCTHWTDPKLLITHLFTLGLHAHDHHVVRKIMDAHNEQTLEFAMKALDNLIHAARSV